MKKIMKILPLIIVIFLTACGSKLPAEETIVALLNEGQDTVEINTEWLDSGAILIVDEQEYTMVTTDSIDISILGLYQVIYTYDYNEQTYTITRYVIVTDETSPVIIMNGGLDTIKVGETWNDASAVAVDNSLEDITVISMGTVNIMVSGTYQIIYTAIDSSGNVATLTRYVTVVD